MDDIKEQEAEMAMERWLEDVGENLELVLDRYHKNIIAMLVEEGYDVSKLKEKSCDGACNCPDCEVGV